jgi:hypothetical protein
MEGRVPKVDSQVLQRIVTAAFAIGLVVAFRLGATPDRMPAAGTRPGAATPSQAATADPTPAPSDVVQDRSAFEAEGIRADTEDSKKPRFAGWINGIYIFPPPSHAPKFVPDPDAEQGNTCSGESRVLSEEEVKGTKFYLEVPAGLPSGATESEDMLAASCDGRITVVSRQFTLHPYGEAIGLVLRPGANASPFPTSADRVEGTTVNGMRAVVIAPVTAAGYGNSAIFLSTSRGLLQVGGLDVPLTVLFEIAESIRFK